jgi:hypothetical protein
LSTGLPTQRTRNTAAPAMTSAATTIRATTLNVLESGFFSCLQPVRTGPKK